MGYKLFIVAVLLYCFPISTFYMAAEDTDGSTLIYETQIIKIPEDKIFIDGKIYKPTGEGLFPLVVITHGRNRDPAENLKQTVNEYNLLATAMLKMNFIVVFVLRRGYGTSQGNDQEDLGRDPGSNMYPAAMEAGKDIKAAVDYMKTKPYIDSSKIVLMGHSMGGQAVMAASTMNISGVIGIVNFAGGIGGARERDILVSTWKIFGKENKNLPSLWLYAKNDSHFDPGLVAEMYSVYIKQGGRATYISLPECGKDGHFGILFSNEGIDLWLPYFEDFLKSIGLDGHQQTFRYLKELITDSNSLWLIY